jgi:SAM-dependent methyltransferase
VCALDVQTHLVAIWRLTLSVENSGAREDRPSRVPDDWYVGFHRGLAARFWRAAGATMVDRDARVVEDLLALAQGATVLDVPCGDGRLTLRLAAGGYAAIGIDLAAEEVAFARRAAANAGADARFVVGDLRALPDVGVVDAVVSWGNSFGYLTPADTARSLMGMRRALRLGGRLILESLTVAESLLTAGVKPTAEYEFGGVRMSTANHYRAAESRLETDFVFTDADGVVEHARAAHHVHTTGEVVRLLHGAGFAGVELLGADGTSRYELGSSRLIAVATAA